MNHNYCDARAVDRANAIDWQAQQIGGFLFFDVPYQSKSFDICRK